ncbi:DUF4191 domain-containing protein [Flaviflexus equikiangi]|uniref:DUF4191 domain-containing protein n=1 Tax=Flaviflexus equikiangi TaxID=2758573 RepID=A0ABS2TF10_9ACTO|nr:DUF4191 domain-containing protein [Flaviflexus equikiangi]MBM9433239.1 DUF4191 domain-containing protein [Flaviflexus equikiangi]
MAKDKKDSQGKDKNPQGKRRWYQLLGDGFKIARKSYPALPWILIGVFLVTLVVFVGAGILLDNWILWTISGVVLAPMFTMVTLTRFIESASYKQMEGIPGAASAVIGRIRRGWSFQEEPVRFNARHQDMVFRLIGKPGIVLVTEGPVSRVAKLVEEEKRQARRIAPNVPVHTINVGTGEDQVRLSKLMKSLKKLPKKLNTNEVGAVTKRYDSIKTNQLPIPKGIDPYKMRPDRKATRGR